jgi:hypothetical protein
MQFSNEEMWNQYVEVNSKDGYGKCCVGFAREWAEAMESKLAAGATVADCARACCSEVDARPDFGITGFMYGAAVSMLAKAWKHGEQLRRWHNIDTQIGDEGAKANESGGVLNPAILTVGPKDGG